MIAMKSITEMPSPPNGLSDAELEAWWIKQIAEPDGTIIMRDDYGDATAEPISKPAAPPAM